MSEKVDVKQAPIPSSEEKNGGLVSQSFFQHIDELKNRVIKSVLAIVICAFIVYAFIEPLLAFVVKPVGQLVFTSPADAFLARITLTLLGGLFLSLPIVLYQVWQFVASGLKRNEKKYALIFTPISIILFLMGAMFAYFVAMPISIAFLLGFSSEEIVPMITIRSYVSFVGSLVLAFGVIFELPIVLMFLAKIGIATPAFLEQKRKHAVVILLMISAILTPPDIITMIILAGPLVVLYEIGIMATKLTYKESF